MNQIPLEKPVALTAMTEILPQAFEALKQMFEVGDSYTLALTAVDSVSVEQLRTRHDVAAITLRKMQLLNAIAPTGVRTATDVVVGLCLEISRGVSQLLRGAGEQAQYLDQRKVLIATLGALKSCGTVIGTMLPPGDIAELI